MAWWMKTGAEQRVAMVEPCPGAAKQALFNSNLCREAQRTAEGVLHEKNHIFI